jgi:hypothetical protein
MHTQFIQTWLKDLPQFMDSSKFHYLPYGIASIVLVLALGYWLQLKGRSKWGKEELISRFSSRLSPWTLAGKVLVYGAVFAALIIIAAAPIRTDSHDEIPTGSMQVAAVIDASGSMAKEDYRDEFPDENGVTQPMELGPYGRRIDMVKKILKTQIFPAIKDNEFCMSLFGQEAKNQMECEFGLDKALFELDTDNPAWIDVNQARGDGSSDPVKGLQMALKQFADSPAPEKQKVILLFTDGGMDGDGKDLSKVVQAIQNTHIKVFVIGIGSEESGPIRTYNANGTFKENLKLDGCQDKDQDGACLTKLDKGGLDKLATTLGATELTYKSGEKLAIDWTHKLGGTKPVRQERHVYHSLLLTAVALLLLIELRGLPFAVRRRRR